MVIELSYPVKEETIGQFTGLLDTNGNKIFEGDLIYGTHICNSHNAFDKVPIKEIKFIAKIIFDEGTFCAECIKGHIGHSKLRALFTLGRGYFDAEFEIIGNIYDNLELIKENNL